MKINAILLLSAVAAIAVATPISSSQRSLYRRDRFRRQLTDVGKTVEPILKTVPVPPIGKVTKRKIADVTVNGKEPVEGTQELVGGLVSGATNSNSVGTTVNELAPRELPGIDSAAGPVVNTVQGLTNDLVSKATDATAGHLAARGLPDVQGTVGPVVETVKQSAGSLLPETGAPVEEVTNKLSARDLQDVNGAVDNVVQTTGGLVDTAKNTVGPIVTVVKGATEGLTGKH
ncbi:hypothetical protein BGW41_001537 [Actinomortierella wolfii]|nr:hypothetical protein BGW41_001537 [Actinomortierella wolfii]